MIEQTVEDGMHEDFYITNYTGKKMSFSLELALRSDFADIFEVREKRVTQRGKISTEWKQKEQSLRTAYDYEDFHRAITYQVPNTDVAVGYATDISPLILHSNLDNSGKHVASLFLNTTNTL